VFYDLSHRKVPSFFSPVTVNMIPYGHTRSLKSLNQYNLILFCCLLLLKGNTAGEAPTANFIKITEAQIY
jgi:hypothetical protein